MDIAQKKASKKRKIIVIIACLVVVALAIGGYMLNSFLTYKKNVAAIQIRNADLSAVKDGEYFGESDTGMVGAKVKVVVKDHLITEIELIEHKNGRGEPAEVLPDKMIAEQRIDVDAVSGATSSSNVIRDAVYNALTGADAGGR